MAGLTLNIKLAADGRQMSGALELTERQIKQLGRATQTTQAQMSGFARGFGDELRGLIGTIGGLGAAWKTISTASALQDMETRLKSLSGSAAQLANEQKFLRDTAQALSADYLALSDSYVGLLNLEKSGLVTHKEARQMLTGLAETSRALGASTEDVKNVMRGLGQGLAAGTLRAEEFAQIFEPLPALLMATEKAMGLQAGQLRKMVNEGEVTSEMIKKGLIAGLQEFEGQAEAASGNISASWERLQNSTIFLVETFKDGMGNGLATVLDWARNRIDEFARHWQAFGIAFIGAARVMWEDFKYYAQFVVNATQDLLNKFFSEVFKGFEKLAENMGGFARYIPGLNDFADWTTRASVGFSVLSKQFADNTNNADGLKAAHDALVSTIMDETDAMLNLRTEEQATQGVTEKLEIATGKLGTATNTLARADKEAAKAAEAARKEKEKAEAERVKAVQTSAEVIRKMELENTLLKQGGEAALRAYRDREAALRGVLPEHESVAEALHNERQAIDRVAAAHEQVLSIVERVKKANQEAAAGSAAAWQSALSGLQGMAQGFAQGFQSGGMKGGFKALSGNVLSGGAGLIDDVLKSGKLDSIFGSGISDKLGGFMGKIPGGGATIAGGVGGLVELMGGDTRGGLATLASTGLKMIPGWGMAAGFGLDLLKGMGVFGKGGRDKTGMGIEGALRGGSVTGGRFDDANGARSFSLETSRRKGTVGRYGHDEFMDLEQAVESFADSLSEQVKALGEFIGQDLLPKFNESFEMAFDFEAASQEELAAKLQQFYADATNEALSTAAEGIDTSSLTGIQSAFYDLWEASGFAADAIGPIITGLQTVQASMQFMGLDANLLNSALVTAAGGMEALQSGLDYFYQHFVPEAEREAAMLANAQEQLNSTFADLGLEVPATRAEFRALIMGIQGTGDAASETFARLMGILTAADAVYSSMESAPVAEVAAAPVFSGGDTGASVAGQHLGMSVSNALDTTTNASTAATTATRDYAQALKDLQKQIGTDYLGVPTLTDRLVGFAQSIGAGSEDAAKAIATLDPARLAEVADEWGVTQDEFLASAPQAVAALRAIEEAAAAVFANLIPDIEAWKQAIGADYLGIPDLARQLADLGNQMGISAEEAAHFLRGLNPEQIVEIAGRLGVPYEMLLDAAHEAVGLMQEDAEAAREALAAAGDELRSVADDLRGMLSDLAASALDDMAKAVDAEKAAADEAHGAEMARLAEAHEAAMATYSAQIDAANEARGRLAGIVDMLRGADVGPQSAEIAQFNRREAQAALAEMAQSGVLDADRIAGALAGVQTEGRFSSQLDAMRDAARTADSVRQLTDKAEAQLTDAERTVQLLEASQLAEAANFAAAQSAAQTQHDANIAALDLLYQSAEKQVRAALGQEEKLITIEGAQEGINQATRLIAEANAAGIVLEEQTNTLLAEQIAMSLQQHAELIGVLTGAPGFAAGGEHAGGVRLVGENGPELELTGPSRIISNSDATLSSAEIVAELRALRADLERGQAAIAKSTFKSARYLERWDGDGLPPERAA
jgi:tape measure domain-containing protein